MSKIAVDTLQSRIENVIKIHREAKDITFGELIGVLEIIKMDIYKEQTEDED